MRQRTLQNYESIRDDVRQFIRQYGHHDDLTLDQFIRTSGWSRRHVQRALAHLNTSWRSMLAEGR